MNLVDSSGWIEFFVRGSGADYFSEPLADTSTLVVPTICLVEVFRFVLREHSQPSAMQAAAAMVRGGVVELDPTVSLLAGRLGVEHSLPLADSIVYATAQVTNATVWTQDSDFENLPNVRYRPKA